MKIVFLDKDSFQKPEESFNYAAFHALGECHYFANTPAELIAERAKDADVLVVLKTVLNAETLAKLKNTKLICKIGTGVDRIDVQAAKLHHIMVANFPGHAANMVAQWTISLLLMLAGNILNYDKAVKNNKWSASQFSYPITEIRNKTLGIIGYGKIGQIVSQYALALGMNVLVSSQYPTKNATHISFVDKDVLFRQADFISLHCLLNDDTRNMINTSIFNKMKPTTSLINTARAALVDKNALIDALKENKISGVALDGFWVEPPEQNEPLFQMEKVIITPHVAWGSKESRQILLDQMAERIKNFLANPQYN